MTSATSVIRIGPVRQMAGKRERVAVASGHSLRVAIAVISLVGTGSTSIAANVVGVADAPLEASFYSDASCLLTINSFVQSGKTVIDADVGADGSRMLIHCDTEDGRRLTLLARGDSLNTEQRAPLLNRAEIAEGEFGMLAWLTRSGFHYSDDSAPRRYVIGGSVSLRKSPAVDAVGTAPNSSKQSFASINGVLEPIVKSEAQSMQLTPTDEEAGEITRAEASDTDGGEQAPVQTTADAPVGRSAQSDTGNVVR